MGRLHQADPPASSSHSLHSLDDAPPPYTDDPEPILAPIQSVQPPTSIRPLRLIDSAYVLPGVKDIRPQDKVSLTLEPALSSNCDELCNVIGRQIRLPPRPLLYIHGTHSESSNDKKDKKSNTVSDFNFKLDLAETMLTGWEGGYTDAIWREVEIITDEYLKPAYRGGILRSRTYKPPKSRAAISLGGDSDALLARDDADEQDNSSPEAKSLRMWCERFCRDPASVKSYALPLTRAQNTLLISINAIQIHSAPQSLRFRLQRHAQRPILTHSRTQLPRLHKLQSVHRPTLRHNILPALDQPAPYESFRLVGCRPPAALDHNVAGYLLHGEEVRSRPHALERIAYTGV